LFFPSLSRSLALALALAATLPAQEAGSRPPLTQAQVVLLLSSGVSPTRVRALVDKFGVSFVTDADAEATLRSAGADDGLIRRLRSATPAQVPSPTPEPGSTRTSDQARPSPRPTPAAPATAPPPDFLAVPGLDRVFLARHEVTRREYLDYCQRWKARRPEPPPTVRSRGDHPVVNISWDEAVLYCRRLSQETRRSYRLPTEDEWERAATTGEPHRTYPWRNGEDPKEYACFGGSLCRVGSRRSNERGFSDMAGNAAEWVKGRDGKPVAKGGSWANSPEQLHDFAIASRQGNGKRSYEIGFRLALVAGP
jgi:hypothetical protein